MEVDGLVRFGFVLIYKEVQVAKKKKEKDAWENKEKST